jgi:hypothetical protein
VAVHIDREHPQALVVPGMVASETALVVGVVASPDIQLNWAAGSSNLAVWEAGHKAVSEHSEDCRNCYWSLAAAVVENIDSMVRSAVAVHIAAWHIARAAAPAAIPVSALAY